MLKIYVLTLGDYQTNCYVFHQEQRQDCLVIDPGYEPRTIASMLESKGLTPAAILLTHGHFDHVGAVKDLAAETDCDVYIHTDELSLPPMLTNGSLYHTHAYPQDGCLQLAGMDLRILSTPGHSPGSVCLITEDVMFAGDTLFAGSCGRTDLPGGSSHQMRASLKLLSQLPGDYTVCPGHGPATTLERERQTNPYL